MKIQNRITDIFGIKYPIVQGGMAWTSGWRLASAVSNCGGLGLIGAGSMKADLLREHIQKCRAATDKPFGVNITLLREDVNDLVNVTIEEGVKIVFSSAGHPGKFIELFKKNGIKVAHVVSSLKFALKAESVGCDAVVGEGVEAGGHNGADEISTFCLTPQLADALSIPVMAAGGIADGRGILAALALGAEGVQIGTRFAATTESSAHENYKQRIADSKENDTVLILRKAGLVRTFKNEFVAEIQKAEAEGASAEALRELVGKKKERLGIFEGDAEHGFMEAGQSSGLIHDIPTVSGLFAKLIEEYDEALSGLTNK